jgi:hypothetical protein
MKDKRSGMPVSICMHAAIDSWKLNLLLIQFNLVELIYYCYNIKFSNSPLFVHLWSVDVAQKEGK